jgi:Mn2+/Fe2+ NRAMP family transporter
MIAIQLVSAQIGRVTGKGIIANVKDFAPRWLVISLVSMLVMANMFNIAADFAAMGEALSLVIGGLSHEHAFSRQPQCCCRCLCGTGVMRPP